MEEKPFFVLSFIDIDTIILERKTNYSEYCDIVFLEKNLTIPVKAITSVSKSICELFVERINIEYNIPNISVSANLNWNNIVDQLAKEDKPRKSFAELYNLNSDSEDDEISEEEDEDFDEFDPNDDYSSDEISIS